MLIVRPVLNTGRKWSDLRKRRINTPDDSLASIIAHEPSTNEGITTSKAMGPADPEEELQE